MADVSIRASFLEIYNEQIKDLLMPSKNILELREDHQGTIVAGLSEMHVQSAEQLLELLYFGN